MEIHCSSNCKSWRLHGIKEMSCEQNDEKSSDCHFELD